MPNLPALARYYAKNPKHIVSHPMKAVGMLFEAGPQALLERVGIVNNNIAQERKLAYENNSNEFASQLLKQRKQFEKRNLQSVLDVIRPHSEGLFALDVLHDPMVQIRAIKAHIFRRDGLFDETFYKARYLPNTHSISPLDHYISIGLNEGLMPNALFDPVSYLVRYPDTTLGGLDPLTHYALFGWQENRQPSDHFDGAFYLAKYPDVKASGMCPLGHYLSFGDAENRLPLPLERLSAVSAAARGVGIAHGSDQTILIVSHDAEVGGAQSIVKTLARWILASTNYNVKILCLQGGEQVDKFEEIAPVWNYAAYEDILGPDDAAKALKEWAGENVCAAFLNSVPTGKFFSLWDGYLPTVAYIHELPKIIELYDDAIDAIIDHADIVVSGSRAVQSSLISNNNLPEEKSEVVYDFIDDLTDDYDTSDIDLSAAKETLGLDPEAKIVLGCGVVNWRKSPELFIDVASRIKDQSDAKVQFVWIGNGEDFEKCQEIIDNRDLSNLVKFVGFQRDVVPYFQICDIYMLPSEEDPFPLVCMYAALAGAPILCFEEAGGMPEFVGDERGTVLPFLDAEAMTDAVLKYLNDEELRVKHGQAARREAIRSHTIRTAGPALFHNIREVANLKPAVSVVVPNYNYENYLDQRLDTIAAQTFQDFEVVLLDDKSPDGSVEILRRFAEMRPGTQLVINEVNSGSPFTQWLRGMSMSSADVIWVAESDDYCEPNYLATMLPFMQDRNIFLAYCKSVPVSSDGVLQGDYEDFYLNRIADGRWSEDYVCTDHREINTGLGIANCIPNASSMMFRNFEPDEEFSDSICSMRLCGDWYFYVRAIRGGKIAYACDPLNYHRRHETTVTHSLEGSDLYFKELDAVRTLIADTYVLEPDVEDKIDEFVQADLRRFGRDADNLEVVGLKSSATGSQEKVIPSLIVVTPDLAPGGGQIFNLELANYWAESGGRVALINVRNVPDHSEVVRKVSDRVMLLHADEMKGSFEEFVEEFDADVIQSSIWWADKYVATNISNKEGAPKRVVSMHGCHETFLDHPEIDLSFDELFEDMLDDVDTWVYTADKNRAVFEAFKEPSNLIRIDNGMPIKAAEPFDRVDIGVREDAIVLCLAARGIEEKGFFEAVKVVEKLNDKGISTDLILLGEGPAVDDLKERELNHVHLFGQVSNLERYLATSDIGIVPSFFIGESMPLVMIEMLGMGLPIVATDVGEIPQMLRADDSGIAAGTVVPLIDGRPDVDGFVEAITKLETLNARQHMGSNGKAIFEARFTIEGMVESYSEVYKNAMEQSKQHSSQMDETLESVE